MAFDPSKVAPAERKRAERTGAIYGSDDVVAQTDVTLNAWARSGSFISGYGFRQVHAERLADLRTLHSAALVTRNEARAERKTTNVALHQAVHAGKDARNRARSTLFGVRNDIAMLGASEDVAVVNAIDTALARTQSAGGDPEALRQQLEELLGVARHERVKTELGDEAATLDSVLATSITAIETTRAAKARAPGTRTETDYIDFLEGLMIDLLRLARRAARAAARALGQPALADEFELNQLYRSTGSHKPKEPSPAV